MRPNPRGGIVCGFDSINLVQPRVICISGRLAQTYMQITRGWTRVIESNPQTIPPRGFGRIGSYLSSEVEGNDWLDQLCEPDTVPEIVHHTCVFPRSAQCV